MTTGVPLPLGAVWDAAALRLETLSGAGVPLQARALDLWPDGSIRWALLDWQANAAQGHAEEYVLGQSSDSEPERTPEVRISTNPKGVEVEAGGTCFRFDVGGAFPFSSLSVQGTALLDAEQSGLRVELPGRDSVLAFAITSVQVVERGPLRVEVAVRAAQRAGKPTPLEVFARVELFSGSIAVRTAITVRNTRRARHPGGVWVLGDEGSLDLGSATLVLKPHGPIGGVRCAPEAGTSPDEEELPFEIHQESSGGEHWDGPVHRNGEGVVPLRFRGYRIRSGAAERFGLRASPVVVAETAGAPIAVAVPQFWQNFPRAVSADAVRLSIDFLPGDSNVHELQGGEQKTHVIIVAFGQDTISNVPLAWCHDPIAYYPAPAWSCSTGAVPFLVTAAEDSHDGYLELVAVALDPDRGFLAKRERFDEYGWRHFGDLPGDHESAFQSPDQPFVSHYNNQYDAIAAFATHFLRTGDVRWWRLMDDLARHVRDIDIYHTREDKAAYNGGLFWHTQHYTDAGTSTHRTYPPGSGGGGPSAEHNYTLGLMLHYFMTGEAASRDAAIGLARWVIDMDDGRLTPLRWLADGPTGLASATGSMDYHGPGRGSANSIRACLVAYRLTGDTTFAKKADELVGRCVHPHDDLEARNLLDVERRWYYTVFLQALGVYLNEKVERGEADDKFEYARSSLLHYARWATENERPYLERPEVLEHPTETWAAQDLRKADALWWAAAYAPAGEREWFRTRAQWFFDYATAALQGLSNATLHTAARVGARSRTSMAAAYA